MMTVFTTPDRVVTPWFNRWNADAYVRTEPFAGDPWDVATSSTSGAPVVLWEGGFVGLTTTAPATFRWEPGRLEVEADADALFVHEGPVDEEVWLAYYARTGCTAPVAPYGRMPEYCTWGDQIWAGGDKGGDAASEQLSLELIDERLAMIAAAGWPTGRYTVDEGWCPRLGPGGFGDWRAKPKMGSMSTLAERISAAGHIPGLWLSPLIHHACDRAQAQPELLGERVAMGGECSWNHFHYLSVSAATESHVRELLTRVHDWGFLKLKLDIFYGRKRDMMELCRIFAEAAASVSDRLELECHVPDPFCSRYFHVLRINDVLISPKFPGWRDVVNAHYSVCRDSSPHHLLNLDHIGGNIASIPEDDFLEHTGMQMRQLEGGYPVVGMMPQRVSEIATEAVGELLQANQCFCATD
jgi:hypothetical protein